MESMSSAGKQAAMTIQTKVPTIPQAAMEPTIPYGTFLTGFLTSSAMWTQESKAPMVHAAGKKPYCKKAQPSDHGDKFSKSPKMNLASLNLPCLAVPTGNKMKKMTIKTLLQTMEVVCKLEIPLEVKQEQNNCKTMQPTKTP
ncbi:hypothetical protein WICPIJ_005154 [Wickerhamomyces pijperi]|uniref:Uncharacterized protein n=1 Tax=Wickerhamomyces pijperi TaxID=599730 RepID=A0A9P8TML8_WICPI|nr:hypothetical protein WICPIJ_005154 [Wickerhamomyces pijperi]